MTKAIAHPYNTVSTRAYVTGALACACLVAALVYAVRRVSPWPKPPAVTQSQGASRGTGQQKAGSTTPGAPEGVPAANGATPPGGAT